MNNSVCSALLEQVAWDDPSLVASLIVLLVINVMVIVGNCLVIAAVFISSKLRSVTNLFIVSLAVADLMVGLAVLPFSATWEVFKVSHFLISVNIKDISIDSNYRKAAAVSFRILPYLPQMFYKTWALQLSVVKLSSLSQCGFRGRFYCIVTCVRVKMRREDLGLRSEKIIRDVSKTTGTTSSISCV
jgi:hypothetical protein